MKTKDSNPASISNIYKLDGKVPVAKAIPFGIQHILAMFVSNLTPIILIAGASGLDQAKRHSCCKMLCLLRESQL